MCGIAGIIDFKGINKNQLLEMRDSMVHRGPDDAGVWINKGNTVGLAHRRLSIIDLSSAGKQPMSGMDETVWITYNGEIYNFPELRKELQSRGYVFKSNTDTEVILYAYKEWGTECLNKLNGMFAFGLYDEKKNLLFLARDRVGKKPIYYFYDRERFIFSSELKALLRDRTISKDINLRALNHYLTFGYIGGQLCIFKSVRKLPPAHALTYDINSKKLSIWQYWKAARVEDYSDNEEELLEELEALIEDAVKRRMISDVPLGAFLSGGVDSSLVVAMMCRVSNDHVKTFSIGFEEGKYNELPYARIVADHFNTEHSELIVKADAFSVLPELVKQFDEPFADSSMIPTYYVSKATREFVTVALSGDGGDELFGGYTHYLGTLGNYYMYKFIPSVVRKGISSLAELFPERLKGKRQFMRLRYDPYGAYIDRISHRYFKERYRKQLFSPEVLEELRESFWEPEISRKEYFEYINGDLVSRLTYTDFKTYLPDDILVKVDRTSMLVSLEVRAPLLDYRIAEFSFQKIPGNLKVKRIVLKYMLKKLARRLLPDELKIDRKWGFSIPVSEWFRGKLKTSIKETLINNDTHLFNKRFIERLLYEHNKGIDHGGRLFALFVFLLWWRNVYE